MANAKISALSAVTGTNLDEDDVLAIVNSTTTKKVKYSELISTAGLNKISGTPIPSAKINFADDCITDGKIGANAINTIEIKDDQITGPKLSDSSIAKFATSAPTADFTGQLWIDTDSSPANRAYVWDGSASAWDPLVAGTGTISGAVSGIINTVTTTSDSGATYTVSATIDDFNVNTVLAGPATGSSAATPTARALVGADIPVATSSAKGGVIINGNGLTLDTHTLKIDNTVSAHTGSPGHLVKYSANGLITSGAAITAGDLPVATASAIGGIKTGTAGTTGIAVSGAGEISINNSVTGATKAKVTYDANGLITAGADLADSDLPNHSAALLTSGTLPIARIDSKTITGAKLADASTCVLQSVAQSGYPTARFTGELFYDSVAEDCFIWDGNAWMPITTLTKGSLTYGGIYNATTNRMTSCTTAGLAKGLSVGAALPTASETVDGLYVVVGTAGTGASPAPAVSLAPPDYILGVHSTSSSSWQEIDLSTTVVSQVASEVGYTAYGQIAATNVQSAINELEDEKLAITGGTLTGHINLDNDKEVRLMEADSAGSAYVGLKAPSDMGSTSSYTLSLPATAPAANKVLKCDSSTPTTLVWSDDTINALADGKVLIGNGSGVATAQTVSGDITITNAGVAAIGSGVVVNADVSASAAIDYSKLAALTDGNILVGNGSNVATSVTPSGDITLSNAGAFAIASGVVVNADVNASAAIDYSKLAALTDGNILVGNGSNVATSVTPSGDVTLSNAGAFAIASGVVVNADVNASAAIDYSKLAALTDGNILVGNGSNVATSVTPSGDITLSNAGAFAIASGVIVDADVNASAAIAGSKIAAASTSAAGAVQLSDSATSTSTSLAATANRVKVLTDEKAALAGATFTGAVVAGAGLDTVGQLTEACTVTAGKLSDNTNLDLANGNVFLFTTAESTTCTPNLRWNSSTTLTSKMSVGDSLSVVIITTANANGYSAQLTLDGGAVTENWMGGDAPDEGGSSGKDVHSYTIIKTGTSGTANNDFTVLANHTKTS